MQQGSKTITDFSAAVNTSRRAWLRRQVPWIMATVGSWSAFGQ